MFCKGNERRAQWQMKTKISLDMAEPHLTLFKGNERRAQNEIKRSFNFAMPSRILPYLKGLKGERNGK
jgi:hypothetical protein